MKKNRLCIVVVLVGILFSTSNASSLKNIINKNTLNGMLRIRFYNESKKDTNDYHIWRTNAIFIFGIPINNNLKIFYRVSAEGNIYADDDTLNPNNTKSNIDNYFKNDFLFLRYTNNNINIIAGKIPVHTPITSKCIVLPGEGMGAIINYKINNNLSIASVYTDTLESENISGSYDKSTPIGNSLYSVAAIYKNNLFSTKIWYFHIVNLLKYIYTIQTTIKPVKTLTIHLDYASSILSSNALPNANKKIYYNISTTYTKNKLNMQIGYANTDNNIGIISIGHDAPIGDILPTEQIDNISNLKNTDVWYTQIKYSTSIKTNFYAGYTSINDKTISNNDSNEYIFGYNYAYNKKLRFETYYDILKYKTSNEKNNNEFQIEAKYIF